ncbi:hypothetical protein CJ030_MR7G012487 [Morella rubra]|uniref:Uncharacterized protein n=1 Tax=Morella rubra TaxID=262757 RepID=A0A6A1V3Z3_9ROSI|nr:hypothetical protein CJ030_MR7G012487 [Morella rubra]
MALNKNLRTTEDARNSGSGSEDARNSGSGSEDEELEKLEKLESNVKEMAHKILEYRSTLPDQLRTTLASVLTAQRPVLPDWLEPGLSGDAEGQVKSSEGVQQAVEDQEIAEKVQLLKDKISSNISAVPTVLKRMREFVDLKRNDKGVPMSDPLYLLNGAMQPALEKERDLVAIVVTSNGFKRFPCTVITPKGIALSSP